MKANALKREKRPDLKPRSTLFQAPNWSKIQDHLFDTTRPSFSTGTMNWSLSFGYQEWDCFDVPPSVVEGGLKGEAGERDRLARRLIRGQDIGMVDRVAGDDAPVAELLGRWLGEQATAAGRP